MWTVTINWSATGGLSGSCSGSVSAQSDRVQCLSTAMSEPSADAAGVGEENAAAKAQQSIATRFFELQAAGSGSIDLSSLVTSSSWTPG
jgi:hypothetical protein